MKSAHNVREIECEMNTRKTKPTKTLRAVEFRRALLHSSLYGLQVHSYTVNEYADRSPSGAERYMSNHLRASSRQS